MALCHSTGFGQTFALKNSGLAKEKKNRPIIQNYSTPKPSHSFLFISQLHFRVVLLHIPEVVIKAEWYISSLKYAREEMLSLPPK